MRQLKKQPDRQTGSIVLVGQYSPSFTTDSCIYTHWYYYQGLPLESSVYFFLSHPHIQ